MVVRENRERLARGWGATVVNAAKMYSRLGLAPIVGAALWFMAACASQRVTLVQPTTIPAETLRSEWHISFSVTGGLAGLQRQLELSDEGRLTVVDKALGKEVTAQLPEETMREIRSWVTRVAPARVSTPPISRCRDCLSYKLEVRRGTERLSFSYDDINLSEAEIAPFIELLSRLLTQALAGKLTS